MLLYELSKFFFFSVPEQPRNNIPMTISLLVMVSIVIASMFILFRFSSRMKQKVDKLKNSLAGRLFLGRSDEEDIIRPTSLR